LEKIETLNQEVWRLQNKGSYLVSVRARSAIVTLNRSWLTYPKSIVKRYLVKFQFWNAFFYAIVPGIDRQLAMGDRQ